MFDLVGLINSIANSVGQQVGGALNSVIGQIGNAVQNVVVKPIATDVSGALDAIGSGLDSVISQAESGIGQTLNTVGQTLGNVEAQVVSGFTQSISGVEGALSSVVSGIEQTSQAVVGAIGEAFNSVSGAIGQALQYVGDAFSTGAKLIEQGLASAIQDIITPLAKFIEGIPHDIETIAGDIQQTLGGLTKEVVNLGENIVKAIEGNPLIKKVEDLASTAVRDVETALTDVISGEVSLIGKAAGIAITDEFGIAMARISAIAAAEAVIGALEETFPSMAFIMGRLLNHISDTIAVGDFRALEQAGNLGSPNRILGVGELVEGRFRGTVADAQYYDELARAGFDRAHADTFYDIGRSLLGVGELVALYYRGEIADKQSLYDQAKLVRADQYQVDQSLKLYERLLGVGESIELWRRDILPEGFTDYFDDAVRSGITPERLAALKESSYKLPTIFDQQEFIRRQVDDEQFVSKWGLDFGLDDEYYKIAKANGYDKDTAKRMYRRYWSVPPFFITEGLYKSGKLSKDAFRTMLIMEGFTPQWADLFIEQLQPTLTLSDIKDLYKYQVITGDQIVEQLTSIGLTPELAAQYQKLWEASVKLASPLDQTANQTTAATIKQATESLIKTGYKDHVITRDAALQSLKDINYSDDAANLVLDIADYELQQQNIKDTYTLVKDNYLSGQMALNDALQALIQAGASHDQVVLYQDQLEKAGSSKPRTPTLANFDDWYKKGIIDASQLATGISLLGYSDVWVPFYLAAAGVSASDITKLGYTMVVPSV